MQIVLSRAYDVGVSSMIFFTFYIFDTYFDQSLVLFENVGIFGGSTRILEKSEFPPVPSISRRNSRGPESYGRNYCRLLWILFNSTHVYVVSIFIRARCQCFRN